MPAPGKNREDFFLKRPGVARKYEYPGTCRDFAVDVARGVARQNTASRMPEIIAAEAARILGKEISLPGLESQLKQHLLVSTADHHALLNDKLLYNSNLLYAEIIKELGLPFMVVLATGSIPMKSKSHPRGFFFRGQKVNFFGEKQSKLPVFLFQGKLTAARERGLDSFCISCGNTPLTVEEKKFLEFLFFQCLEVEKAARDFESFSDQITFLNFKLWKYYYDECLRHSLPGMIYLQANSVLLPLLLREIEKEDSLISAILFEPAVRRLFLKNFNGIPCCWSENRGTQLFRGVIERKNKARVIELQVDEAANALVGEEFNLKLEREEILAGLVTKKILSTLFLDFLITTFIEGGVALGGFNQVDYLPQMQQAHVKTLKEIGLTARAEEFARRWTDGMICGMFPFDFASGIDLLWHYNSRGGIFNGHLDRGLTRQDLERMLEGRVKDMIGSAIETMGAMV
jgi:hypothetical protein